MFYRTDPTGRARAREHAFAGALGTSDLLVPLGRRDQPPAPGKPDSAMRDAREPPTTREEYVALIADAIADAAARAPPARRAVPPVDGERADRDRPSLERLAPPSARAGRWTVYAVSDLHADVRANADWARALPVHPPFSALIVAGDVATSPATVVDTLAHLTRKFEEVFWCPGNHELWTPAPPNEHHDAGHPANSLGKLKHLIERVSSVGVRVAPTLLPGSPSPATPDDDDDDAASVVVVPMLSWYDDAFGEGMGRGPGYSPRRCTSTRGVRGRRASAPPARRAIPTPTPSPLFSWTSTLAWAPGRPARRASFRGGTRDSNRRPEDSHRRHERRPRRRPDGRGEFLALRPARRLYRGARALAKVMGSATVGLAVRTLRPAAHVFGHSHGDVDETIDGTRYVQRALGYPNERWGGMGGRGGRIRRARESLAAGKPPARRPRRARPRVTKRRRSYDEDRTTSFRDRRRVGRVAHRGTIPVK